MSFVVPAVRTMLRTWSCSWPRMRVRGSRVRLIRSTADSPSPCEAEMTDARVLTERQGHVFLITINRPEARNAFDAQSAVALEVAADTLDADDSLFVGVITGAGGTFSAGADLKAV